MANRSILDIEIPDEKMKRFKDLFDKYHAALKTTPAAWAAAGSNVATTGELAAGITAAMLAQHEVLKKQNKEYDKQRNTLEHISRIVTDVGRGSGRIVKDIASATIHLIKWASIGGLVGAGGLFGIDRLAQGVVGGRAAALGTGGGYGGTQAFRTQFGQYLDPAGLSQSISQTVSGVPSFGIAAEVQQMARSGMTTDQIALALLPRAVQLFRQNPTTVGMRISGLDQFFDLSQMKLQSSLPEGEMAGRLARSRADTSRFDLSPDVQEKWASLDRTLGEAGKQIETTFITKLVSLTPQIERLSRVVADVAGDLGDRLGPVLERFSGWLERHFGAGAAAGGNSWLDLIRKLEGSGDAAVSPKGAVGRYQILPSTAAQYGFTGDLKDPAYNQRAASAIIADLQRRYNGNMAEVLVGYNAGPGMADKFRAAGDDLGILPKETKDYLTRAGNITRTTAPANIYGGQPAGGAGNNTRIILDNRTGADISTITNQVGPP